MHETTFTQNLNDTLTYGVLIITTTKSSSWLNSKTGVSILYGITRPSQNDKNMPRVSGRATVRLVCHLGIILNPGSHGQKDFLTQSSVRSFLFMMEEVCLFPLFFFYLSFIMAIEWTITVHTGRRTDEWLEGKKKDRLIAD